MRKRVRRRSPRLPSSSPRAGLAGRTPLCHSAGAGQPLHRRRRNRAPTAIEENGSIVGEMLVLRWLSVEVAASLGCFAWCGGVSGITTAFVWISRRVSVRLGFVDGNAHLSFHRHRGFDLAAAADRPRCLYPGLGRPSPVDPRRAFGSWREGDRHAGRRIFRGVLRRQWRRGGGHGNAVGIGRAAVARGRANPCADGLHSGEASDTQTGLVGFDVHRAARVAGVAHGGQILLSETAAALVRDALPIDASLRDLGAHRLKVLGHPERLFQLQAPGLDADFPAVRSLDHPELANNLPARSATFIGRRRELEVVGRLVNSSRFDVTGAGGVGKTRLAWQVAAELLDGSGDGVWLVELAAVHRHREAVASDDRLARFGIVEQARAVAAPDDVARRFGGPGHGLIVLDNCEHLIGGLCRCRHSHPPGNCAKVHVLATSREPLGVGGENGLPCPFVVAAGRRRHWLSRRIRRDDSPGEWDAVALFVERVRSQGGRIGVMDEAGWAAGRVDLQAAGRDAARDRARRGRASARSPSSDLSERLDQRFRLLTGGNRSALPRQQTLLATVQWSYSLLSETEQTLLRRLSVFVDGFDLQSAEEVCSLDDIEVFDVAGPSRVAGRQEPCGRRSPPGMCSGTSSWRRSASSRPSASWTAARRRSRAAEPRALRALPNRRGGSGAGVDRARSRPHV